MSAITNNAIVRKATVVNFKLLTFLFAFSIVLHIVAGTISPAHPVLGGLLTLVEIVGWLWIVSIWTIAFMKGIWKWIPIIWTNLWSYVRMHIHLKKAGKEVSIAEIENLRSNMDRLGLALYGMTPALEKARRMHFQMLGKDLPALVLPSANAALYTEFSRLAQFLNSYGFPDVESVRLHPQDFEFAQNWGQDIEIRLLQSQKHLLQQQQSAASSLSVANQIFLSLSTMDSAATENAGYQRIHGALNLLGTMVRNNHCSDELVSYYIPALQRDMDALLKQLKKAVY